MLGRNIKEDNMTLEPALVKDVLTVLPFGKPVSLSKLTQQSDTLIELQI
jgi:hypothetical protein